MLAAITLLFCHAAALFSSLMIAGADCAAAFLRALFFSLITSLRHCLCAPPFDAAATPCCFERDDYVFAYAALVCHAAFAAAPCCAAAAAASYAV